MTISVSNKVLDHQVGDQASTVKMSLTAKVTGITISKKDMDNLARAIFQNKVPDGFVMNDDQIDFNFEPKDVDYMINLLPSVDINALSKQILGKNISDAKTILSHKVPGYDDANITIKPKLPFFGYIPHVPANITMTVSGK